ncbi:hypothetical protein [Cupriavidus lacunae]|nr:hypothetical protein [Cupriavidus lacunae]
MRVHDGGQDDSEAGARRNARAKMKKPSGWRAAGMTDKAGKSGKAIKR